MTANILQQYSSINYSSQDCQNLQQDSGLATNSPSPNSIFLWWPYLTPYYSSPYYPKPTTRIRALSFQAVQLSFSRCGNFRFRIFWPLDRENSIISNYLPHSLLSKIIINHFQLSAPLTTVKDHNRSSLSTSLSVSLPIYLTQSRCILFNLATFNHSLYLTSKLTWLCW